MKKPAIVLAAYNRPKGLKRILESLLNAEYSYDDIPLIISIDKSDNQVIPGISKEFYWPHGEKKIILHKQKLGLKNHFIRCGDLTKVYGSIIFLEDDLFVSPYFYHFAIKALNFYSSDKKIAGISLYNIKINESANRIFEPVHDGFDVFFAQLPSWGPIWNREEWNHFKNWLNNDIKIRKNNPLPSNVLDWPESSFKKYYIKYLVMEDKYFVYPRISLVTNFCDEGEHYINKSNILHVPILLGKKEFYFNNISSSNAIYDSFLEILPECLVKKNKNLKNYDFEVDLYGLKDIHKIRKEYILTCKSSQKYIFLFSRELHPHETDILLNLEGNKFKLCKLKDVSSNNINLLKKLSDIYYDVQFISIIKVILADLKKIIIRLKSFFI